MDERKEYKIIFSIDSIGDFLDTINNFDSIKNILWDNGGFQLTKENGKYFVIYENDLSRKIENIWKETKEVLEIALNDAYYKRMRYKTLEFFKKGGLSDLEIIKAEYNIYVNRFKFNSFCDFDFEKEDAKTIEEAIYLDLYYPF